MSKVAPVPAHLAQGEPGVRVNCWICGSPDPRLVRKGALPSDLAAAHFRITDKAYGCTADIYQCRKCGFRQSSTLRDVLHFYEEMGDNEYEATRAARALQARMLLRYVARHRRSGSLLDVGAGSGILVQEALACGYQAEGIEPSRSLFEQGQAHGLPLHHGVLPYAEVPGPYDVVTLVDVIEHVGDPVKLLRQAAGLLNNNSILVIVTPDVGSIAARLLGWRWWHYRIAHIGYFNRDNLALAMRRAGLEIIDVSRPAWYFPASYLAERALTFVPAALRFRPPELLERLIVRLNLFDSLTVVARKARNQAPGSTL
jgi:2-polyprenyl-3-methyl-5-hydroxy-6-metoxy-1,4-benzoquinol methylase